MKELLYFLVIFIAFIAVVKIIFDLRMRKHPGVSRDEFLRAFSGTEISSDIPAAVYDYYKKMVIFKEFGVAPDDTYQTLRKGEEDIEDDAVLLMNKLGLKPPSEQVRLSWDDKIRLSRNISSDSPRFSTDSNLPSPIQTLRDMVLWLDWVRQHQESI